MSSVLLLSTERGESIRSVNLHIGVFCGQQLFYSRFVPNNIWLIIDKDVLLAGCDVIRRMEGDMVEKMRAIVPRLTAKLYKVSATYIILLSALFKRFQRKNQHLRAISTI